MSLMILLYFNKNITKFQPMVNIMDSLQHVYLIVINSNKVLSKHLELAIFFINFDPYQTALSF